MSRPHDHRTPRSRIRTNLLRIVPVVLLLVGGVSACVGQAKAQEVAPERDVVVGVAARPGPHSTLTPLVYWGGFVTKTACYDGLVEVDDQGALVPGLLSSWQVLDGGRRYELHLRPGVVAHDGTVLSASDVADHLVRWRGNPAHRWLGSTDRIERIEVPAADRVVVTLSEPWPFMEECAGAINPAYVVPPGAYDHEGTFQETVGTGPYRLVGQVPGEQYTFAAHAAWWGGPVRLPRVRMDVLAPGAGRTARALEALRRGDLDVVADGSSPLLDREALDALAGDPDLEVRSSRGSATTCLVLNAHAGPFQEPALRQRLARALDRARLVREVERGHAEVATSLFCAPGAGWPVGAPWTPSPEPAAGPPVTVRLLVPAGSDARSTALVAALAAQLQPAGFEVEAVAVDGWDGVKDHVRRRDFDALLRDTYGLPYDPWITLQAWFDERAEGRTASSAPALWQDDELRRRMRVAFAAPPSGRAAALATIQAWIDEQAVVLPLVVPHAMAIARRGLEGPLPDANGYDLHLERLRCVAEWAPRPVPVALSGVSAPVPVAATPEGADPRKAAVPLAAAPDWDAWLVHDNKGTGVWTVGSHAVFPHLAAREIVGLDDAGRLHVCWSYSGKWTPIDVVNDGEWLGGLAHADVDPRVAGAELYTGGKRGNLYQVTAVPGDRVLSSHWLARIPGREIHTIVAGDLDPRAPGQELLVFTHPGGLYLATPTAPDGGFELRQLEDLPGLVRQALLLPADAARGPEVVTVGRDGALRLLRVRAGVPTWTDVAQATSGRGRVALRPASAAGSLVLYTTLDDGCVERHEQATPAGPWATETIYAGPAGPRGIVAGRFDADPSAETVAVFGYSQKIQLLRRVGAGPWSVQTIFHDIDKGHWLTVAEAEGRNGTDEIVASGYSGRIVLLARPPGYGMAGVAVDPEGDR